ncbi:unnamed protein product [Linum trigynum]|uniref:Uncharacterized protein n=1 Tax=Linum trigynum TaxID=586398 RepID=A0AAV2CRB4_9ROSI
MFAAVAQDVHDQEEAREEDETEPADSWMDQNEDRKHDQVQCEAQALAPHQARVLSWGDGTMVDYRMS